MRYIFWKVLMLNIYCITDVLFWHRQSIIYMHDTNQENYCRIRHVVLIHTLQTVSTLKLPIFSSLLWNRSSRYSEKNHNWNCGLWLFMKLNFCIKPHYERGTSMIPRLNDLYSILFLCQDVHWNDLLGHFQLAKGLPVHHSA